MKHATRVRARYGETDQAGVVYHATYLSWFEVGRTELMRDAGTSYAAFENERKLRLTVVLAHLQYHAPGYYDEPVRVESWIDDVRRVRFVVRHRIVSDARDVVLATGHVGLACVAFDGRITAIPGDILAALSRFTDEAGKNPAQAVVTPHHGRSPA